MMDSKTLQADSSSHENQDIIMRGLLRQWWVLAVCCLIGGSFCFGLLYHAWRPEYALRWLWLACAVFLYVFGVLRVSLSLNHRKDETALFSTFGVGTLLTTCRGVLISMLAGFLFLPWYEIRETRTWVLWLPGTLYVLAGCADYFDGYFARKTNHVTRLGEAFDTKMDALGILSASFVAISAGQLPLYYATVGLAYYILHLALWWRKKRGKAIVPLLPYPEAKLLAGIHMGFIGVALFPIFAPLVTTIAALILTPPFLLGFIRDWLVISGRMRQGTILKGFRGKKS